MANAHMQVARKEPERFTQGNPFPAARGVLARFTDETVADKFTFERLDAAEPQAEVSAHDGKILIRATDENRAAAAVGRYIREVANRPGALFAEQSSTFTLTDARGAGMDYRLVADELDVLAYEGGIRFGHGSAHGSAGTYTYCWDKRSWEWKTLYDARRHIASRFMLRRQIRGCWGGVHVPCRVLLPRYPSHRPRQYAAFTPH
ncbi:MAG: hypothetical protein IJK04_00060 [Kiritimatiellae bacterium]|nr:hypothetical protein [Kiritimatiellia bacterium]